MGQSYKMQQMFSSRQFIAKCDFDVNQEVDLPIFAFTIFSISVDTTMLQQ